MTAQEIVADIQNRGQRRFGLEYQQALLERHAPHADLSTVHGRSVIKALASIRRELAVIEEPRALVLCESVN